MAIQTKLKVGGDIAAPIPNPSDLSSERVKRFGVDLTNEIVKELNLTIEYKTAYWKNIIAALVEGKIDVICSAATVTKERKKDVAFSRPYLNYHLALVCNKDGILTLNDLKVRKIGVRRSTEAEEYLKHTFPGKE